MGAEANTGAARLRRILIALGVAAMAAAAPSAGAKTWTVKITGMQFDPATVTVGRGDTVVWVNEDPVPHTVTSAAAGRFDSHQIEPGGKWHYVARTAGSYPYACTVHPTMKATLLVKGK